MALLSRADIESSAMQTRRWEDIPVPEWGKDAEVRVMELSGADRGYIDAGQIMGNLDKNQNPQFRVEFLKAHRQKLVAAGLVDENFKRLYAWKDVEKLDDWSARVLDRIAQKVRELSGMDVVALKEAEGNSDAAPSASSDSD